MKLRILVAVTLIALLGAVHSLSAADAAGKWQFVLQTDGGPREAAVELKIADGKVTGTWDTTEVQGTYADGKLNLSFPFSSPEAGMTATLSVEGQLEGEVLSGTWKYGEYGGTFKATRRTA
jgi:hypothetical protein